MWSSYGENSFPHPSYSSNPHLQYSPYSWYLVGTFSSTIESAYATMLVNCTSFLIYFLGLLTTIESCCCSSTSVSSTSPVLRFSFVLIVFILLFQGGSLEFHLLWSAHVVAITLRYLILVLQHEWLIKDCIYAIDYLLRLEALKSKSLHTYDKAQEYDFLSSGIKLTFSNMVISRTIKIM